MKIGFLGLCLGLSAVSLMAQESETEALRKQLKQATENFDKALQENRKIIDALSNRLETLERQRAATTNAVVVTPNRAPVPGDTSVSGGSEVSRRWSPASPIRLPTAGQNYISLSFDALATAGTSTANDIEQLQPGGHDPKQRGFTIQNLETTFEGKVDPYFRGQATISMQLTPGGETIIEAEEAYLETMSLPWNLQVKAGQFFSEFGRQNATSFKDGFGLTAPNMADVSIKTSYSPQVRNFIQILVARHRAPFLRHGVFSFARNTGEYRVWGYIASGENQCP